MTRPVFRFAPSPNGRLHLGHAYSALLNADLARHVGGRFLLRIEDIDPARCRPALEQALYDDLRWLGLTWESPVRRQSEHFEDYRLAASRLKGRGLLYPCFCSRKAIGDTVVRRETETGQPWTRDPDQAPLYPGTCRSVPRDEAEERIRAGEVHSWRIDLKAAMEAAPGPHGYAAFDPARAGPGAGERWVEADPERWGDAILVRKDTPTSYHLAVVADDGVQGITHVVRGRDLEAATDLHVLLQKLLGLPTPRYHHHGLILDPMGDKLSKSRGSETLEDLRARGIGPGAIRRHLGFPDDPRSADAKDLEP
jgi:glutamyl-Q tRNA(Asp) synthetase